jgi:hypothetical protein
MLTEAEERKIVGPVIAAGRALLAAMRAVVGVDLFELEQAFERALHDAECRLAAADLGADSLPIKD